MPGQEKKIYHSPVLLLETLELLQIQPDKVYLDCTLGGGGHAWHILQQSSPSGHLIGIDRDEEALKIAREKLFSFQNRISLVQDNFINLEKILARLKIAKVDGILFDLGFSNYQLTDEARGFSFKRDGPLDMRMDKREEVTAAQLINKLSLGELTKLIYAYGEERWAARIAENICQARKKHPLVSTLELAKIITGAIPSRYHPKKIHPATKTFQALRIAVNKELEFLEPAISDAVGLLDPGGRICLISYQSLEDRIVKQTFKILEKGCLCPPSAPVCVCGKKAQVKIPTKQPVTSSAGEVAKNPSARSAKLRVAEKT
jgi:16S rRNA (cytosine1402-N4)-methyltransferase